MRDYTRPMFSQKHYEEMCFELNNSDTPKAVKKEIIKFLIVVFRKDSNRFDVKKFQNRCEAE